MRSKHGNRALPALSTPPAPTGVPQRNTPINKRLRRSFYTACIAYAFFLSLTACAMQDTSSFDSATWKAQRGVALRENKRLGMLDDVEARLRIGMSREEVIDLLGAPDASDSKTSTDTYELGVSSVGIDGEVYKVHYQDGKLATHRWSRW